MLYAPRREHREISQRGPAHASGRVHWHIPVSGSHSPPPVPSGAAQWALFAANPTDPGAIAPILVNTWGTPDFVNPAAFDYHIGDSSAAIDQGVDAGVRTDMDGQPRPIGLGFDIGADEAIPPPTLWFPMIYQ